MVRSFSQWTKTLSFPARLSPAKASTPPAQPENKDITPVSSNPDLGTSPWGCNQNPYGVWKWVGADGPKLHLDLFLDHIKKYLRARDSVVSCDVGLERRTGFGQSSIFSGVQAMKRKARLPRAFQRFITIGSYMRTRDSVVPRDGLFGGRTGFGHSSIVQHLTSPACIPLKMDERPKPVLPPSKTS
ncbi:hypothetical protein O3M35_000644 [Rhynocoris fuscipes]|uniref:Uncharacterized protein n=1 Tax=Rhynocoris fuscipes TaxID=488301 RepID=A0AAW1DN33_9HEMI